MKNIKLSNYSLPILFCTYTKIARILGRKITHDSHFYVYMHFHILCREYMLPLNSGCHLKSN